MGCSTLDTKHDDIQSLAWSQSQVDAPDKSAVVTPFGPHILRSRSKQAPSSQSTFRFTRRPPWKRKEIAGFTSSEWTTLWIIALYVASLVSTINFRLEYPIKTQGLGNRKVQAGPGLTQLSMQHLEAIMASSSANTNKNITAEVPASAVLYEIAKPYLAAVPGPSATDFPACVLRNQPDTYGLCGASWKDLEDGKFTHVLNYQFVASRTTLKNRDRNTPIRSSTVTTWALTPIPVDHDRANYQHHGLSPLKDHWIPTFPSPAKAADCRQASSMPKEVQDYCLNDQPNLMAAVGITEDTGLYLRAYYLENYPVYISIAGIETSGFNYATVRETMVRDPFTFEVEIDLKACEAGSWNTCFLVTTRQSIKNIVVDIGAARITIWIQGLLLVVLPFLAMRIAKVDLSFTSMFVSLRFGVFNLIVVQLIYYLYYDVRMLGYYRPLWSLLRYHTLGHVNGWMLLIQFTTEVFTLIAYVIAMIHEHTSIPKGNVIITLVLLLSITMALACEATIWNIVDKQSQYQTCTNGANCAKYGVTCCGDVPTSYFAGIVCSSSQLGLHSSLDWQRAAII